MTDKTKNRNDSYERDGMTGDRQSWAGKLALALQPFGTEKAGLWFTHKAVKRRLQDQGHKDAPENLNQFLYKLVLSGHVERALRPNKKQYAPRPEYIYRRTAKPYIPPVMGKGMNGVTPDQIQKAYQIRLDHGRLPKWFRDMMT